MKAPKAKKQFTNDELAQMLKDEKAKSGAHVYTDRRKTIEQMLSMRGVKI
jgi:hypothetical protein